MMELAALGADSQTDQPPTVGRFHQVGVTQGLDGTIRTVTMGENGIFRVGNKRAPRGIAAGDGDHVAVTGAALSDHEVIFPVDFVQVRSLGPDAAGAPPYFLQLPVQFVGLDIDFGLADKTVAHPFMPVVISGSVLIKKQ